MEDIAEKARRNLMGVATGIIAVWALGIPLDGKLVGAVNLNEVEPWRAWLCALVVLAYFYCRFSLAPQNLSGRAQYRSQKKQAELNRNIGYALSEFELLRAGQKSALTFKVSPPPFDNLSPAEPSINQEIIWDKTGKSGLAGTILFHWLSADGNHFGGTYVGQAEFRIPLSWLRRQMLIDHWKRIRRLNWEGLEVTLPTTLTLLAGVICLTKLITSLYYSWPFVRPILKV